MNASEGLVVKAIAGRDSGRFFAVVKAENKYCFIADGKSRKLGLPKRKSIKHLMLTEKYVDLNNITDKKLRKQLREFSDLT